MVLGKALSRSIALAVLLAAGAASAGTRVEPMAYELTPSGNGAQQDLRVENTGARPTPIEIRVERREILPDGTDKRTPADDDFLVFPPQGIVPANGFQTFRIRYVGNPRIQRTSLYTITVAQLPVEMDAQDSGVQLLFNLGTLAAVSPAGSQPVIEVMTVEAGADAGFLRVTVRNNGTKYARLKTGRWTLTAADGRKEVLEGQALSDALPQPLIEPGTTRIIKLPVGTGFAREGAKATFEFDQTR